MFSTRSKTEIIIFVTFKLVSANSLNLVSSKILSCRNRLTISQKINFRPFLTERVCRQHFQIGWQWQKVLQMGKKHLQAISPFPTVFSLKRLVLQTCKKPGLVLERVKSHLKTALVYFDTNQPPSVSSQYSGTRVYTWCYKDLWHRWHIHTWTQTTECHYVHPLL